MVSLAHLHPATRALAMLPTAERLARCGAEHWIGYTRANQVLARLEALVVEEPGKVRPHNLLLVGPSNNGKTMIAEKFCRAHPQRISLSEAAKAHTEISSEIAFVGLGHKFQIWEPSRFRSHLDEAKARLRTMRREIGTRSAAGHAVDAPAPRGARE